MPRTASGREKFSAGSPRNAAPERPVNAGTVIADPLQPLNIIAHENVLNRMTAALAPLQPGQTGGSERLRGMPVDEYFMPTKDMHFNDEAIVLYHAPKAHTDGDSLILFRGSDVVSAGDVFTPGGYPFIDVANGGSVAGEIAALNHLLLLAVPAPPGDAAHRAVRLVALHAREVGGMACNTINAKRQSIWQFADMGGLPGDQNYLDGPTEQLAGLTRW